MANNVQTGNVGQGSDSTYKIRLFISFWLFGTLIAMQFSVVVAAANDLVGDSAPQGIIMFAYTAPSLMVRTLVPFVQFPRIPVPIPPVIPALIAQIRRKVTGALGGASTSPFGAEVDYPTRLVICALSSFFGLQLLAWSPSIALRMVGIALASLSSNLGDMSFWQLATRYPLHISTAFGGYAAGGVSAGLLGSFLYTLLTNNLGVSPSAAIAAVGFVPTILLFTYALLLPNPVVDAKKAAAVAIAASGRKPAKVIINILTMKEKLKLVQPLVLNYMCPLAFLFLLEGHVSQAVLPSLLFPTPFDSRTALLPSIANSLFHKPRDFYPVYITLFATASFLGRTSISFFRLPGGNSGKSWAYWGVCGLEVLAFLVLLSNAVSMTSSGSLYGIDATIILILCSGPFGGLLLSNTYWKMSKKPLPPGVWRNLRLIKTHHSRKGEEDDLALHDEEDDEETLMLNDSLLDSDNQVRPAFSSTQLGSYYSQGGITTPTLSRMNSMKSGFKFGAGQDHDSSSEETYVGRDSDPNPQYLDEDDTDDEDDATKAAINADNARPNTLSRTGTSYFSGVVPIGSSQDASREKSKKSIQNMSYGGTSARVKSPFKSMQRTHTFQRTNSSKSLASANLPYSNGAMSPESEGTPLFDPTSTASDNRSVRSSRSRANLLRDPEDLENDRIEGPTSEEEETATREFLISTIAPADTVAILFGSLGAMFLQSWLCNLQVGNGRELCRGQHA